MEEMTANPYDTRLTSSVASDEFCDQLFQLEQSMLSEISSDEDSSTVANLAVPPVDETHLNALRTHRSFDPPIPSSVGSISDGDQFDQNAACFEQVLQSD